MQCPLSIHTHTHLPGVVHLLQPVDSHQSPRCPLELPLDIVYPVVLDKWLMTHLPVNDFWVHKVGFLSWEDVHPLV